MANGRDKQVYYIGFYKTKDYPDVWQSTGTWMTYERAKEALDMRYVDIKEGFVRKYTTEIVEE